MVTRVRWFLILSAFLFTSFSAGCAATEDLLTSPLIERRGRMRNPAISESSGLIKSRQWPGVFWTHNDSGDHPRIFPILADGQDVANGARPHEGLLVTGARNIDWEDIAADDEGNLIIGDIGSNVPHRTDLAVYRVKEPDPYRDQQTAPAERFQVFFPDRSGHVVNSEALFWARGKIYILPKTRGSGRTGLYRLDLRKDGRPSPFIPIGFHHFDAPVTAADASPDGRYLAVLTYQAIWLFERPTGSDNYLAGKRSSVHFLIWQCEAVCFDGDRLLISNEGGSLFELETSVFPLAGEKTAAPLTTTMRMVPSLGNPPRGGER